jgi:hypothetical protein
MGALEVASLIAGPVIGVAGLGSGGYYFWHANRRNQLRIKVEPQSLLGGNSLPGLTIRYDDQPVHNPYLVRVSLTNDGPKDIRSTDFENGSVS